MNDLNENTLNPNCFEKTKEAWAIFSFFSSTNVETKNVCPIAYNGFGLGEGRELELQNLKFSTND
jgi:hypothetical protein